ncbi:MAG TPA: polysaccharide deacetylase family protein [Symbiobacteriaceae bacterium]|nr:polysaccharide deacetylase family protein [Symbiobacteriaceae bacterium]
MRLLFAMIVIACVSALTPTRVHTEGSFQVPVLLYHNLTTDSTTDDAATLPVAEFAAQMAWLEEHEYTAITTGDLENWLLRGDSLPPRPVLITFDDGYQSNFDLAFPLLQEHGLKATIFVVTGAVGQQPGKYPHLSAGIMQAMERSGLIEFQAHSHDGHRLVGESPALLAWSSHEIAADFATLLETFASDGLPRPAAFAYPFGAYGDQAEAALRETGFDLAFTVEPGYARLGESPLRLQRQIIYPGTPLCHFAEIVEGRAPGSACPR